LKSGSGLLSDNTLPANGTDNFSKACFKFFFVLGQAGITAYRVAPQGDPEGPIIIYRAEQAVNLGISPLSGIVDPSGKWMYVGCDQNSFGEGAASVVPFQLLDSGQIRVMPKLMAPTGFRPSSIAFSPNRKNLYASTDSGIYQYNISSPGHISPMKPLQVPSEVKGGRLVFTPDGKYAYCANAVENRIYQLETTPAGQLKPLEPRFVSVGKLPAFAQVSRDGHYLWCLDEGDEIVERLQIGANGQLARLSPATPRQVLQEGRKMDLIGVKPTDFVVTLDGKYAYVARSQYDSVLQFIVNADGTFRENTPYSVPAAGDPTVIRLDPHNRYLVALNIRNKLLSLYSIGGDGKLQPADPSTALGQDFGMSDVIFEPKQK
jgi:DNA-binding beta-propeller fold protein YncE